jgi:hypothetical protein
MKMDKIKVVYCEMLLDVMKFHKILLRFNKYLKILSSTGKD